MLSRHRSLALGIVVLLGGLSMPVAANSCQGCPCPMGQIGRTPSTARATRGALGPALTCCTSPLAREAATTPGVASVSRPEVAPPTKNAVAVTSLTAVAAISRIECTPVAHDRPRAERRYDRGLCILNSVFLI